VILITTKKANKDKVSVEYNGTLTFDTQLAKWDVWMAECLCAL